MAILTVEDGSSIKIYGYTKCSKCVNFEIICTSLYYLNNDWRTPKENHHNAYFKCINCNITYHVEDLYIESTEKYPSNEECIIAIKMLKEFN